MSSAKTGATFSGGRPRTSASSLRTQTAVLEGIQERAGELGFCGEVRIQQEAGGYSGHVGVVVVSDHNVSPFDFEKLCLKGGLEAKLFAFHFTTDIFQEKNRGREKIIFPFYITNGQNKSECHDFVSQTFSSLPFNGHFSSKTWYPLSKNFSFS